MEENGSPLTTLLPTLTASDTRLNEYLPAYTKDAEAPIEAFSHSYLEESDGIAVGIPEANRCLSPNDGLPTYQDSVLAALEEGAHRTGH